MVQRRQGLRVHRARRRRQGPVRASQLHPGRRIQVSGGGREGELRRGGGPQGPGGRKCPAALGMASSNKRKTTMAKLNRERRRLEKRQEKQARKVARKKAAAEQASQPGDVLPGDDPVSP